MKYWYLKGEDVLGPADVETIAKDEMFCADLFVCPEPDSEKPDAWQSADQYMQDFGYILDPEHYSKPEPEHPVKEETKTPQQPEDKPEQEAQPEQEVKTALEPEEQPEKDVQPKPEIKPEAEDENTTNNNGQDIPVLAPQRQKQQPIAQPQKQTEDLQQDYSNTKQQTLKQEQGLAQKGLPDDAIKDEQQHQTLNTAKQDHIFDSVAPLSVYREQQDILEETIHSRSPLNAAMDDNLLDEIPANAVLSSAPDTPKEENLTGADLQKETNNKHHSENTVKPKPVFVPSAKPPLKNMENKAASLTEEEAFAKALEETKTDLSRLDSKKPVKQVPAVLQEDLESLDTFTVSQPAIQIKPNQQDNKNDLPSSVLAAQENKKETKPGEALNMLQMPVIMPADTLKEYDNAPLVAPQQHTDDNFDFSDPDNIFGTTDHDDQDDTPQFSHGFIEENLPKDNGLLSVQEDLNNQFIAGPATTGKILNSSDGLTPRERNKRNDLLYLMVMFMGALIIVAVLMMFNSENQNQHITVQNQPAAPQNIPQPEPEIHSVIQGIDEGVASPQLLKTTPQEREALKTENYAENLVRKHQLKTGMKIEEYLTKTYGKDYQARWGSNKLYGNVYVVDFFASKVRSEPIRYMFRVNVDNDTIEGMNNSTIDLLSK